MRCSVSEKYHRTIQLYGSKVSLNQAHQLQGQECCAEMSLSGPVKRSCDFEGAIDKSLRHGTDRPALQRDYSDGPRHFGQLDGQTLTVGFLRPNRNAALPSIGNHVRWQAWCWTSGRNCRLRSRLVLPGF